MALITGTRLVPYEILSPLGAGGMGEVYKARDTRLDGTVAIKVLPAQLAADPQFRDRFDREARAISALDHPHICGLYDVGEQDGTAFRALGQNQPKRPKTIRRVNIRPRLGRIRQAHIVGGICLNRLSSL